VAYEPSNAFFKKKIPLGLNFTKVAGPFFKKSTILKTKIILWHVERCSDWEKAPMGHKMSRKEQPDSGNQLESFF
jgi:hypothetical protein